MGTLDADSLLAEATELIRAADAEGLRLRLLGGLAVRLLCPSALKSPFSRSYSDLDCIGPGDPKAIERFLCSRGWEPDREFNTYNGDRRLIYASPRGAKLDVFVGAFRMCHAFDLSDRLPAGSPAVLPADLLLTKLQIHEINEKDLSDTACLLHDRGPGVEGGIEAALVAGACASDWGVYHSILTNMDKVGSWSRSRLGAAEADRVGGSIAGLKAAIEATDKSLAWRLRSKVGPRMRWFEEVEEVDR